MAINAFFLNGFNIEEKIIHIHTAAKRMNLTNPPDIIQYTETKKQNIQVYVNSVHCCVTMQQFGGKYERRNEAELCYREDQDSVYTHHYDECIQFAKKEFNVQWDDTDWCILVLEDPQLEQSMELIDGLFVFNKCDPHENISFRAFLDCCFIDQSINRVTEFIKNLDITRELTKFQQYQIAYYSEQIFKLKTPSMFLTNHEEIKIYKEIYEQWNLTEKIENILGILNQSVSNYSFLWDYKNAESQKMSSTMLTLFTIVVAYASLKDVIKDFLPQQMQLFKIVFLISLLFFIMKICIIGLKQWFNKRSYFKKTM